MLLHERDGSLLRDETERLPSTSNLHQVRIQGVSSATLEATCHACSYELAPRDAEVDQTEHTTTRMILDRTNVYFSRSPTPSLDAGGEVDGDRNSEV